MVGLAGGRRHPAVLRRRREPHDRTPHEPPYPCGSGPLILAALGLALGLVPPYVGELLINRRPAPSPGYRETSSSRSGTVSTYRCIMSVLTVVLGTGDFRLQRRVAGWLGAVLGRLPSPATGLRRVQGRGSQAGRRPDGGAAERIAAALPVRRVRGHRRRARRDADVQGRRAVARAAGRTCRSTSGRSPCSSARAAVLPIAARVAAGGHLRLGAVGSGVALIFLILRRARRGDDPTPRGSAVRGDDVGGAVEACRGSPGRASREARPFRRSGAGGRSGAVMTLLTLAVLDTPLNAT